MQGRLVSFSLLRRLPSSSVTFYALFRSPVERIFFWGECSRGSGRIAFALSYDFMVNGIALRDYRAEDLDAMLRLDETCFAEEFRFDRESMREFAEERNAIVRVAEKTDGEIVGFVIV